MDKLLKILLSLGMKLLTEKFVSKVILIGLTKLAKSTKTKVDDDFVKAVEQNLLK